LAASGAISLLDPKFSKWMDQSDELKRFKGEFTFPTRGKVGAVGTADGKLLLYPLTNLG
jgi:hypothetical protein